MVFPATDNILECLLTLPGTPNFHIGESSIQGVNSNNLALQQTSLSSIPNLWQNQSPRIGLFPPDGLHLPRKASPPQLAAMAVQTNAISEDPKWFAYSGANAHITNNLNNLTIR
jgi:hypothetical protein